MNVFAVRVFEGVCACVRVCVCLFLCLRVSVCEDMCASAEDKFMMVNSHLKDQAHFQFQLH